ncbi:MAG: hypothetical protein IMZ52_03005 [Actinobacteria bacterium]|nr:hypothetical protein [Actinomycetota bacterium]MBE3114789.1 hypothetical protein [Actinomycetota bacterium]
MNEYLELAKKMANESNCKRVKYGCVIVKDGQILSTGWKCDECQQRKKEVLTTSPDGRLLCKSCYDKIWDEKDADGHIIFNMVCPFCNKTLLIADEKGDCDCGAIYDGGFLDEFYYGYHFYKRK